MWVWTAWIHLHLDFFKLTLTVQLPHTVQLTYAVQTHVVQGSTGGWDSEYAEGSLKVYAGFQLCGWWAALTPLLFKGQLYLLMKEHLNL